MNLNLFLAVVAAVLVAVSIAATGLLGALFALAGVACSVTVLVRIRRERRGGGRR